MILEGAFPRRSPGTLGRLATSLALAAVATAASVWIGRRFEAPSIAGAIAFSAVLGVAAWMFFSPRKEISLAVVLAYLGLLDGYLKLKTNSDVATLGRDFLLYAIVVGILVRCALRHETLDLPPFVGWIAAFVTVVLVQVANPGSGDLAHSLPSVRPHLEFVPLFFLAYMTMRSQRRLRAFLMLLLAVTAINGIVSFYQFNLTPDEFASWGPGYAERIEGNDSTSGRSFLTSEGDDRVRPFALGSDIGYGGFLGVLAIPGALALIALSRRPAVRVAAFTLAGGAVVAVITSQARAAVIGSALAVATFAILASAARRTFRTLLAITMAAALAALASSFVDSKSGDTAFERYENISPDRVFGTAQEDRGGTLSLVPSYAARYPLGAGLGSGGPAAGFGGQGGATGLSAETQLNYLIIELGLPGLLLLLALNFKLLSAFLPRVRQIPDPELRILLSALAASLAALFLTWLVGVPTAANPGGPFFWFAAGTLVYWLLGPGFRETSHSQEQHAGTTRPPTLAAT